MRIKWLSGFTFSGSKKESMKAASAASAPGSASAVCCRQPPESLPPTTTPTPSSTLLSALTSSGKKSRACKCCRSSHCQQQAAASGSKAATATTSPPSGGTKSKKASNWGLKFNCAKLRGTKSSSSGQAATVATASPSAATSSASGAGPSTASSNNIGGSGSSANPAMAASSIATSSIIGGATGRLLRGESEKLDSCVCTAYRKVEDLPSTLSSSNGYPLSTTTATTTSSGPAAMMPHLHHHHHHLEPSVAASSNGPGGGGTGAGPLPNHAFLFPGAAGVNHHELHHAHHHPGGTTTTTTIIHRIERSAAQALYGSLGGAGGHPPANSVIVVSAPGMFDISRFNSSDDFSLEDCDERARLQRELEIREGVDAPPNFNPRGLMSGGTMTSGPAFGHSAALAGAGGASPIAFVCTPDSSSTALNLFQRGLLLGNNLHHIEEVPRVHSQVDFIHCLVPDLQKITSCCFYWGKMDRYEAEKLLDGKPEGTFLLRDSAQEEFLFSVSFRKYSRSLHARIEQFNHKFSFDSRDPGVYTASTVTGLLEHYKDPSCVMFFEPMLTYPLNRNFCFSLQQLCRATIVSHTTYDSIGELCLPKSLKSYLKEYHYRQRVRCRPLDEHLYGAL